MATALGSAQATINASAAVSQIDVTDQLCHPIDSIKKGYRGFTDGYESAKGIAKKMCELKDSNNPELDKEVVNALEQLAKAKVPLAFSQDIKELVQNDKDSKDTAHKLDHLIYKLKEQGTVYEDVIYSLMNIRVNESGTSKEFHRSDLVLHITEQPLKNTLIYLNYLCDDPMLPNVNAPTIRTTGGTLIEGLAAGAAVCAGVCTPAVIGIVASVLTNTAWRIYENWNNKNKTKFLPTNTAKFVKDCAFGPITTAVAALKSFFF